MTVKDRVRFNREYFGYIAGYGDGEIRLFADSAAEDLACSLPLTAMDQHLLETLDVRSDFHLNTPLYVWFELTRRCNLRCPHCYIYGGDARDDEMTGAEFHDLIDQVADLGTWSVAFTGGEPTLHPDFADLVVHARARNLVVGIASNGMFLSEALLDRLPREGVIISVSIDDLHVGPQLGNNFRIASRAILRAQEMGFLTNVMTNTNRRNIDALADLISWARSNGISVRSVPFTPIGRGGLNRGLENTIDDVQRAAEFWIQEMEWERKYHERSGLSAGMIFDYGLTLGYLTHRCSSGRTLCYVAADGTVFPCTMCAGEGLFSPGSVRKQRFADLWRSDWPIRRVSWSDFANTCRGCILNTSEYQCSFRCPSLSHARGRGLNGCGASEFQIVSTVVRTAILQRSPIAVHEQLVTRPLKISEERVG